MILFQALKRLFLQYRKKANRNWLKKGYMYVKLHDRESLSGIERWECTERRNYKCKGKARTQLINSKPMVQVYGTHNHPPIQTDKHW